MLYGSFINHHYKLYPSRQLAIDLFGLHLLAFISCLMLLSVSGLCKLAIFLGLVLSFSYHKRSLTSLDNPYFIKAIVTSSDNQCQLIRRDGAKTLALLVKPCYIGRHLIILRFQAVFNKQNIYLVLAPDNMGILANKRLRRWAFYYCFK